MNQPAASSGRAHASKHMPHFKDTEIVARQNASRSGGDATASAAPRRPVKERLMNRMSKTWREVESALEVTLLVAVECALVIVMMIAMGFPHGG